MYYKLFSITIIISFLSVYGCNNKHKAREGDIEDTHAGKNDSKSDSSAALSAKKKPEALYLKLDNNIKIEVLTNEKSIDTTLPHYNLDKIKCAEWILNKKNIINILLASEEISLREWHTDYSFLPCSYIGELLINGKLATFSINAGAYSTIIFRDSVMNLGYKSKDFKKYFLEGRASPSEYNE